MAVTFNVRVVTLGCVAFTAVDISLGCIGNARFAITEEDNLDFERAEGGRGKLRGQECKASWESFEETARSKKLCLSTGLPWPPTTYEQLCDLEKKNEIMRSVSLTSPFFETSYYHAPPQKKASPTLILRPSSSPMRQMSTFLHLLFIQSAQECFVVMRGGAFPKHWRQKVVGRLKRRRIETFCHCVSRRL